MVQSHSPLPVPALTDNSHCRAQQGSFPSSHGSQCRPDSLSTPTRVCCQSLGGFSDQDVEQVANQINGSSSGLTWLTLLLQSSKFLFPSHAGEHPTPQEEGQRKERLGTARRIHAAHCRLLGKTNPQGRQSQAA